MPPDPTIGITFRRLDGTRDRHTYQLKSAHEVFRFLFDAVPKYQPHMDDTDVEALVKRLKARHQQWKRYETARIRGSWGQYPIPEWSTDGGQS